MFGGAQDRIDPIEDALEQAGCHAQRLRSTIDGEARTITHSSGGGKAPGARRPIGANAIAASPKVVATGARRRLRRLASATSAGLTAGGS